MAEQDPLAGSLDHWVARAQVSIDRGHPQQAVSAYLKALETRSDDPDLHSELGAAYELSGDPDQAVVHHRRALEVEPERWEFRLRLASAYLAREQADLALPLLEELDRDVRRPGRPIDPEMRDAVHEGIAQAIHLQVGDELTVLPDGARIITRASQATAVLHLLDWAGHLHVVDPELRELLDEDRQMAEQALKVVWYWPSWFREGRELVGLRLMPWWHDDGFVAGLKALGFFFAVVTLAVWAVVSVISLFVELGAASSLNALVCGGAAFGFAWLTCRKPAWELVNDAYFDPGRRRRKW